MNSILDGFGKRLAQFLDKPLTHYDSIDTVGELELADILQPCDMLLIEGNTHICHPVNLTDTDRGAACLRAERDRAHLRPES